MIKVIEGGNLGVVQRVVSGWLVGKPMPSFDFSPGFRVLLLSFCFPRCPQQVLGPKPYTPDLFKVEGLGFRVSGLGFKV